MNVEEAITTAIHLENIVMRFYQKHVERLTSTIAQNIFRILANEEAEHIEFLENQRDLWQMCGKVDVGQLKTAIPDKTAIDNMLNQMNVQTEEADLETELEIFKQALSWEKRITQFYSDLVNSLETNDKAFFEGFLDIEAYHEELIQAEISGAVGSGVWFDFMEFDQETG